MGASPATQRRQSVERSRRVLDARMTEPQFQALVVDTARALGWRVAHFRRATMANGRTVTPVAADGAGFPDLVLVHPVGGVLYRELGYSDEQIAAMADEVADDERRLIDSGALV